MASLDPKQPQLHIQAMQSIIPGKISDPGQSRRINVSGSLRNEALQSHLRLVFYYGTTNPGDQDESAASVAAWTKETLSMALSEHPVLAGRLRRDHEGDGYWEIKFNDAGVRMVQATAEVSMAEFLKEEEEGDDDKESLLAYWMDVDIEHPELSALFYIQVTEFQRDGYSIGISCSLLLADPLFLTQFLKKWAVAHSSMMAQARPEVPIFHLGYFTRAKNPNYLRSIPLDSSPSKPTTKTILFKVPQSSQISYKALASLCVKEAAQRLGGPTLLGFSLVVNGPTGELTVEPWSIEEELGQSDVADCGELSATSMDEFGMEELALSEGSRPARVSCRVVTGEHEGLLMVVVPAHDDGDSEVLVSVTIPGTK